MNHFIPMYYLFCLTIEYIIPSLGNAFLKAFGMLNIGFFISFSRNFIRLITMSFFGLLYRLSYFLLCNSRMRFFNK